MDLRLKSFFGSFIVSDCCLLSFISIYYHTLADYFVIIGTSHVGSLPFLAPYRLFEDKLSSFSSSPVRILLILRIALALFLHSLAAFHLFKDRVRSLSFLLVRTLPALGTEWALFASSWPHFTVLRTEHALLSYFLAAFHHFEDRIYI